LEARFIKLAKEAKPLQDRATEIAVEQLGLSQQINLEILTEAFPGARVLNVKQIGALKPIDNGASATQIIAGLAQAKREPNLLIVDEVRKLIFLCEE